ncbi:MAG: FAD-dependent oxidoreductase, partial [Proteobacteria bacterium]|nr:FAD-dependent oxidoreductase [Pseudomonadota bacterium]
MEYDVIIVGAGPAGSTTARSCAEKGLKTLLIEKDRFPRYKPCGGFLSPRVL